MIQRGKWSGQTPFLNVLDKGVLWLIMFALFPLIPYYLNTKLIELLVYGPDNLLRVGGDHKKMRQTRVLLAKIRYV